MEHTDPLLVLFLIYCGWCPPRHLYSSNLYHVWGNLPYSSGDYLTDNILRMVYPQYQDSSYFHDETGFSSYTPYTDTLDVLLSDAPLSLLAQYNTILIASKLSTTGGAELKSKLEAYVQHGGHLVLTVGNLQHLPGGMLGVASNMNCNSVNSGQKVIFPENPGITETCNMTVCDLSFPKNSTIIAELSDSTPLVVQLTVDSTKGSVIAMATPFAISSDPICRPSSEIDATLCTPYPLLEHTSIVLHQAIYNSTYFLGISNLTSFVSDKEYYLMITNPLLKEQYFEVSSSLFHSVDEVQLDLSEKGAEGYLPDGHKGSDIGKSTSNTIAGGDIRLFHIIGPEIKSLPSLHSKPYPQGIALHLWKIQGSLREEILLRPTFSEHFDSVSC